MATRRFANRRSARPSRQWTELATTWNVALTGTTATPLWGLQAPAAAAGLTSLPPEDIIIMRVRGSALFSLSTGTASWVVGVTIQDQTWTPAAVFRTDADKRWLWLRTFGPFGGISAAAFNFVPPGVATDAVNTYSDMRFTEVDFAPKAKLEAGQALYLVCYEETGAATFTSTSIDMRMLWQTKARR